jgi:hypothetical protein
LEKLKNKKLKTIFQKFKFLIASTIVFFVVFLSYFIFNIIATEGFNPSDDGVILAQSFRILNGEIPHKDFISIRPVFSGILHTIHFFSPLALEESARWFVFFQYFIYSILTTFILFKFVLKSKSHPYFILLGTSSLLLNLNFYNLYPWTTIDALFWFSIGFTFYLFQFESSSLRGNRSNLKADEETKRLLHCVRNDGYSFVGVVTNKGDVFYTSVGFLFMAFASLSRQTFILPFSILFVFTAIYWIKKRKLSSFLIVSIISAIPFLIYMFLLISTNSFSLFITQMTGRTELFQTGIITYGKYFLKSKLLIFHLMVFVLMIFHKFKFQSNAKRNSLIFKIVTIYLLAFIFFSFYLFTLDIWGMFSVSFELFFICILLLMYVFLFLKTEIIQKLIFVILIFICWISSISLGDNSLVFTLGILASLIITFIFIILNSLGKLNEIEKFKKPAFIISTILVFALLFMEISAQKRVNYRDNSAKYLTYNLSNSFSEFGSIKTNKNTYDYFVELKQVIDSLRIPKNKFVVIPNNPIIYAITKSKNPFPLDWMQHNEYVGSENYLNEKIIQVTSNENIYLIIDNYDSKKLNIGLFATNYNSYDYEYFFLLNPLQKELVLKTKFFTIYLL